MWPLLGSVASTEVSGSVADIGMGVGWVDSPPGTAVGSGVYDSKDSDCVGDREVTFLILVERLISVSSNPLILFLGRQLVSSFVKP